MHRLLLIWVISPLFIDAAAQDKASRLSDSTEIVSSFRHSSYIIKPDSSNIEPRSFDKNKLKELRADDDLDYQQPPSVAESLWDRIFIWLGEFFEWLFRGATRTNWGQVFLYTLALGVMVLVIMMLLKVDALRVFYSGADKGSLNYSALDENIHEMDFDKLIREALENQEFRLGVRLTFLYSLKLLSDKHHLEWRPGKTNYDYQLELKDPGLKTGFNELSFYFDYAWYGEFSVNENLYKRVKGIFEDWRKKIE